MHSYRIEWPGVDIRVFSPEGVAQQRGFLSWSLLPLQTQKDVSTHYALAIGVRAALRSIGVRRAYAPNVGPASAAIVSATDLKECILLGGGVSLYRNHSIPADGVFLKPGDAFVMSAAGCPVIIATDGEHMLVAHAGRDSLIDRNAVMGLPMTREHLSIVDAIIAAFKEKGVPPQRIDMHMQLSIPAAAFEHRFDHPQYGAYNRALSAFVDAHWPHCTLNKTDKSMFLDLESVCVEQARQAGLRYVWATSSLGEFPSLAHTRDGNNPYRRNLVLVKRTV